MAKPRDLTALLPAGLDPYTAEERVRELWLLGFSADAIAYKAGVPVAYARLVADRLRGRLRDAGVDWKRERGEKLLALNQDLRNRLLARIQTAPEGEFSINDVRELRELMLLEMKQLGLLSPEKFQQVGSGKSYDELVELCKMHGIPVPGDHYGPDEPPVRPPAGPT